MKGFTRQLCGTLYTNETFRMENSVDNTFFSAAAFDSQQFVVDSLEDQREFLKAEFENIRTSLHIELKALDQDHA